MARLQQIDMLELQEQELLPVEAKMRQMGSKIAVCETNTVHDKDRQRSSGVET